MPLALILAQVTGISQKAEFVNAILVITSLSPIQVYINEAFATASVRYNEQISLKHGIQISLAIFALTGWLAYRLELDFFQALLVVAFGEAYVWFSYEASRRVLGYQADSIIGGRYSYLIGSIIPITFLLLVVVYWLFVQIGLQEPSILYGLILLPNAIQYIYTRFGWMGNERTSCRQSSEDGEKEKVGMELVFFLAAMLMAFTAQHWKIELANVAAGFAALSIYLISPFSSLWLIHAKSRFMTKNRQARSAIFSWIAPCGVFLTLLLNVDNIGWGFMLALVTQILTFKFITDIRLKSSRKGS